MNNEQIIVNKHGQSEEEFLELYDSSKFNKPSVTVDMLLFTIAEEEKESYRKLPSKVLQVLLIKRGDHPDLGQWALPGGFVEISESLDAAAMRELKEETNIDNIYMEQLYTWGEVKRDRRTRVISVSYMSLVDNSKLDIKAADDAEDVKWFTFTSKPFEQQTKVIERGFVIETLHKLALVNGGIKITAVLKVTKTVLGKVSNTEYEIIESSGIAFDHAKIIHYGLERLRNKIEYTDIAFNLMPDLFSLTELQKVYEIILDKELLKANFRRKIASMVVETNHTTKNAGHRPSKLYKFNPKNDSDII